MHARVSRHEAQAAVSMVSLQLKDWWSRNTASHTELHPYWFSKEGCSTVLINQLHQCCPCALTSFQSSFQLLPNKAELE